MKMNITTSVDNLSWQKAKDNNISWSDALEFGINFLSAEIDGIDYPPSKLMNRISAMQNLITEKCTEIENLKQAKTINPIEKEADEIFKEVGVQDE